MLRVGMWYSLMTKACVLKVAEQPSSSLWPHPEWNCFAAHTTSVQQLFPFAQRRHFWVAQPLCAVFNVLAPTRTITQGHCALGMIPSLGSFLVVYLVMICVFCHASSWAGPWPWQGWIYQWLFFSLTAVGWKWKTGWQNVLWYLGVRVLRQFCRQVAVCTLSRFCVDLGVLTVGGKLCSQANP